VDGPLLLVLLLLLSLLRAVPSARPSF